MISAWRERWGIGDFAFLATQLGDQGMRFPSYVADPRDAQLSIVAVRCEYAVRCYTSTPLCHNNGSSSKETERSTLRFRAMSTTAFLTVGW